MVNAPAQLNRIANVCRLINLNVISKIVGWYEHCTDGYYFTSDKIQLCCDSKDEGQSLS